MAWILGWLTLVPVWVWALIFMGTAFATLYWIEEIPGSRLIKVVVVFLLFGIGMFIMTRFYGPPGPTRTVYNPAGEYVGDVVALNLNVSSENIVWDVQTQIIKLPYIPLQGGVWAIQEPTDPSRVGHPCLTNEYRFKDPNKIPDSVDVYMYFYGTKMVTRSVTLVRPDRPTR